MQSTVLAGLLFVLLTGTGGQPKTEWSTRDHPPALNKLMDILTAIDKALDFDSTQKEFLNLDGILGIRVVEDQFSLFLEKHDWSAESAVKRDLFTTMDNMRWKARNLSEEAIIYTNKSQPHYMEKLGRIVNKGTWRLDYPVQTLGDVNHTWPDLDMNFTWDNSDLCLNEILGSRSGTGKPCSMTDHCWKIMTFPVFSGYAITHQLLFLEVGEIAGCYPQLSNFSRAHGQGNVSVLHQFLCQKILTEAQEIESINYPYGLQDLFMEQVFLCGILGYQEFLVEKWLNEILSWQDISGCYAIHSEKRRRVKREEKMLQGNCASHKTSVALGALVAFARSRLISLFESEM